MRVCNHWFHRLWKTQKEHQSQKGIHWSKDHFGSDCCKLDECSKHEKISAAILIWKWGKDQARYQETKKVKTSKETQLVAINTVEVKPCYPIVQTIAVSPINFPVQYFVNYTLILKLLPLVWIIDFTSLLSSANIFTLAFKLNDYFIRVHSSALKCWL